MKERLVDRQDGDSSPSWELILSSNPNEMTPGWFLDNTKKIRQTILGTIFEPGRYDAQGNAIGTPKACKVVQKIITCTSGAAANQLLVSPAADEVVDFCVTFFGIVAFVDDATPRLLTATFQDEDDTACNPAVMLGFRFLNDATGGNYFGGNENLAAPLWAIRGRTPTAGKDLEVDIAGGAGAEKVLVTIYYRLI